MNKDITLRSVSSEEYGKVRKLAETIWPVCYKDILSSEQIEYMMDMMYSENVIAREVDEKIHYYFIENSGEICGYLSWGIWQAVPRTAKLHKLYLLPEKQGRGIGSCAIELVRQQLKASGVRRLRLNVNRQNANAIRCYANHGFTMVQLENNDIGNGFFMTDYVMEAKI